MRTKRWFIRNLVKQSDGIGGFGSPYACIGSGGHCRGWALTHCKDFRQSSGRQFSLRIRRLSPIMYSRVNKGDVNPSWKTSAQFHCAVINQGRSSWQPNLTLGQLGRKTVMWHYRVASVRMWGFHWESELPLTVRLPLGEWIDVGNAFESCWITPFFYWPHLIFSLRPKFACARCIMDWSVQQNRHSIRQHAFFGQSHRYNNKSECSSGGPAVKAGGNPT